MPQEATRVTAEAQLVDLIVATVVEIVPDVAGELGAESRFIEDLDMDSLHLMELVARLEAALGVEIPSAVETSVRTPAEFAHAIGALVETA